MGQAVLSEGTVSARVVKTGLSGGSDNEKQEAQNQQDQVDPKQPAVMPEKGQSLEQSGVHGTIISSWYSSPTSIDRQKKSPWLVRNMTVIPPPPSQMPRSVIVVRPGTSGIETIAPS